MLWREIIEDIRPHPVLNSPADNECELGDNKMGGENFPVYCMINMKFFFSVQKKSLINIAYEILSKFAIRVRSDGWFVVHSASIL